jgi:hypothetical protein
MAEMFNYKINYFRNAGQMAIFWIWNNTHAHYLLFFPLLSSLALV